MIAWLASFCCSFGRHRWMRWTVLGKGTATNMGMRGGKQPVVFQERTCKRCGKIDRKVITFRH